VSVHRHDQAFDPALGALYEELSPQLLRYAEGILGSRADAEEAVQDAFLAAASAVPLSQPRLWLFRVTRNAAIDQLRRRRRHLSVLDSQDAEPVESSEPSPHDRAELADDLRILRDGIDRLPEQQRSALMLRELGGLQYREIADVVEASEANVKVLIFRARRSLQEFAEAVRLPCDDAQMVLSARADGEAGKAEHARARLHMATCSSCRTFNAAISGQRAGLAMLVPVAPLAAVSAGAVLSAAAGAGAKAGGGLGGIGSLFGMKAAATAAAVVVVSTGAVVADHEGIGLRLGERQKPVPVKVDRAVVPSDPQPIANGGGGGSGGGGMPGHSEGAGGGPSSGAGVSGSGRDDDDGHENGGGSDDNSGRGSADDEQDSGGSGSSGRGGGSDDGDESDDEPQGGESHDPGSGNSGKGSGESGSGGSGSGSGSGGGGSGSGSDDPGD
jgi:RNA polymerase sigma factor (sigma-70 family)